MGTQAQDTIGNFLDGTAQVQNPPPPPVPLRGSRKCKKPVSSRQFSCLMQSTRGWQASGLGRVEGFPHPTSPNSSTKRSLGWMSKTLLAQGASSPSTGPSYISGNSTPFWCVSSQEPRQLVPLIHIRTFVHRTLLVLLITFASCIFGFLYSTG